MKKDKKLKMKNKMLAFKERLSHCKEKILKRKKEQIIKYGIIGLVVIVFVILGFYKGVGNEIIINGKEIDTESVKVSNTELDKDYFTVEVIGEVKSPGIYKVSSNSNINDMIRISGGITKTGTLYGINLATKVTEGMRIIVPTVEDAKNKICINNCTLDDLISLGLSKSKAQSIINYRAQKTWISYLDEIVKISGITDSDFNQIKEFIIL